MIRNAKAHICDALGALLLVAFAAGCAEKSSTDRNASESQSAAADPSAEEANVEVQQSGNAIVITGINVSGECHDGCAKRQFKSTATMSDGSKVTLIKANYRKLGATGEPEWKFTSDNVLCVKEGDAAFAQICSSANGHPFTVHRSPFTVHRSPFTVQVELRVKTAKYQAYFALPSILSVLTQLFCLSPRHRPLNDRIQFPRRKTF